MTDATVSLTGALPGMREGQPLRNGLATVVHLCLVGIWPFVTAYVIGTNSGHSADALDWLPGIDSDGGIKSGLVTFAGSAVLVWGGLLAVTQVRPDVVGVVLQPLLPTLYLLVLGWVVLDAVGSFRGWWILSRSDADSLLELRDGPVKVTGRAVEVEGTVETPYSGTESLVHRSERQRYEVPEDGDHDTRDSHGHTDGVEIGTKSWVTKDEQTARMAFGIRGDGGTALVEPDGAILSLEQKYKQKDGEDERNVEWRVDPGDRVTVSGVARQATVVDRETHDYRHLVTEPRSDLTPEMRRLRHVPFTLSSGDDGGARTDLLKRAVGMTILSLIVGFPLLMGYLAPLAVRFAQSMGYLG